MQARNRTDDMVVSDVSIGKSSMAARLAEESSVHSGEAGQRDLHPSTAAAETGVPVQVCVKVSAAAYQV